MALNASLKIFCDFVGCALSSKHLLIFYAILSYLPWSLIHHSNFYVTMSHVPSNLKKPLKTLLDFVICDLDICDYVHSRPEMQFPSINAWYPRKQAWFFYNY